MPDLTPSGRFPLLLLPVRIETRFDANGSVLRVRIYPDDVHVDAHDPRLSEGEVEDGRRYHELVAASLGTEALATEAQAWAPLARRYGAGRARWVVRATADGADPETRADDDAQPAEARALPDRWVAAVRWRDRAGAERDLVVPFDEPVAQSLPLTPSADDKTAMEELWGSGPPGGGAGGGAAAGGGVRWMLDFDRAVEAGMAARIDLVDPAQVVDRLVVFGVRGSETGRTDAADAVRALVEAHAYGEGFAFVPQGTPAHNAPYGRSGHDPEAVGGPPRSARPAADANGPALARALGLERAEVFRDAPHAGDREQGEAGLMNTALWRPTWGYYLEQQMSPDVGASNRLPEARRHFAQHVRARGPLPAVRVRRQPYGVLPVSSLDLWTADRALGDDTLGPVLRDLLLAIRPSWTDAAADPANDAVPHVGRGGVGADVAEQVAEIVRVLGMGPHPETVRARPLAPAEAVLDRVRTLLERAGVGRRDRERVLADVQGVLGRKALAMEATLSGVGIASGGAGLLGSMLVGASFPVVPDLPFVQYPPGSPGDGLYPIVPGAASFDELVEEALPEVLRNALAQLRPADRDRFEAIYLPGQFGRSFRWEGVQHLEELDAPLGKDRSWAEAPYPLLYALLWRGAFLQYVRVAWDGLRQAGGKVGVPFREDVGGGGTTPGALVDRFVREVLAGEYGVSEEEARELLTRKLPFRGRVALSDEVVEEFDAFWEAVGALDAIGKRAGGVAALELLLREALSLASHRLDAWATSLASRRLEALREATPEGLGVGGYGWVERIVPRGAPASDGYLHAPSVGQATTAAVLRNGYLSHVGTAPGETPLAVDLSSGRVRTALGLLDGVRAGQSLGELLGYRLERALHEGHPGLELDALVYRLRERFPLVAGKRAEVGGDGAAVPAHVVDGLAVLRTWKGGGSLGDALDGQTADARVAVEAEVRALDDAVDAVSDLAVAEGVHQLVMGNPTRSGAALDALGRGEAPPPEFDVVRTPRSGRALTHRVVVLDGRPASALPTGRTPRARAEPAVNAWAYALLGDPGDARCLVRVGGAERDVRLGTLGLDPIDLVALGAEGTAQRSELDLRIAAHVLAGAPDPAASVEIDYDPPAGPNGTVPAAAVLQAAAGVRRLLADARPLGADDLRLPEDRAEGGGAAGHDGADLGARARDARCAFAAAFEALRASAALPTPPAEAAVLLDPSALASLLAACPGAGRAVPHSLADVVEGADLGALAADVPVDLGAVREALFGLALFGVQGAAPQSVVGDGDGERSALVEQAASVGRELHARAVALGDLRDAPDLPAQFETVFGRGFLVVPRFTTPAAETFRDSDRLQGDPLAALEWAHAVAPVRPRTAALVDALVDAEGLSDTSRPALAVGQLPAGAGQTWAALPGAGDGGRLSFAAWTPGSGTVSGASTAAGLLVDEWTETIPDAAEATGLAFQYDAPGSRPPQSLLLAVPPGPSDAPWTTESLRQVLDETLDLAKARAVDLDGVRSVGHALPALHL